LTLKINYFTIKAGRRRVS